MTHNVLAPLEALLVDISTLTPDPSNARRHSQRNLDAIKTSFQAFGQHQPIVVQEEGRLVRIGNGRLEAAKALGWTHIAAVVVAESNVVAIARAIADNKTAELATWDMVSLGNLMTGLREDDFDLLSTGFVDYEIDPLLVLGEKYTPDISPITIGHGDVTDADMAKAKNKLEPDHSSGGDQGFHNPGSVEVVCPHCAKTFEFSGS